MFLMRNSALLKWCIIYTIIIVMTMLLSTTDRKFLLQSTYISNETGIVLTGFIPYDVNWRHFSDEQIKSLSNLGRYLYLNETPVVQEPQKHYKILVWKYGSAIINRHIYFYGDKKHDPFEMCSVKNCEITYKDEDAKTADAIVFQIQRMHANELPDAENRFPSQIWIFLTDETPYHTFLNGNVKLKDFDGVFNWSMTYRMDSDVPVPYGRTLLKPQNITHDLVTFAKRTDVLVAILGSNCGSQNHRWEYIKELKKHIQVHVYGACGDLKCEGHFNRNCDSIKYYKFYLAFENSNCAQYITEKLWWNAYAKNSIPVVMGSSQKDYKQLLPPKSYIHTADFATPADLARYILYVNKTDEVYKSYFEWRQNFQVKNEHGYFQTRSYHYCRVCEALNYNKREKKVYDKLEEFWSKKDCYPSWDKS